MPEMLEKMFRSLLGPNADEIMGKAREFFANLDNFKRALEVIDARLTACECEIASLRSHMDGSARSDASADKSGRSCVALVDGGAQDNTSGKGASQ